MIRNDRRLRSEEGFTLIELLVVIILPIRSPHPASVGA